MLERMASIQSVEIRLICLTEVLHALCFAKDSTNDEIGSEIEQVRLNIEEAEDSLKVKRITEC